jgi:hypothetical protein
MNAKSIWWVNLVAASCVSVAGQLDSLPHVLKHVLGLIGIVGIAISAYMIGRPPRHPQRRRSDLTRASRVPPDGGGGGAD